RLATPPTAPQAPGSSQATRDGSFRTERPATPVEASGERLPGVSIDFAGVAARAHAPAGDHFRARGDKMRLTGAEITIHCLQDEGVEYVFGYPGGAVLNIYDELFKQDKVKHVLVRHEQGAVHAADG